MTSRSFCFQTTGVAVSGVLLIFCLLEFCIACICTHFGCQLVGHPHSNVSAEAPQWVGRCPKERGDGLVLRAPPSGLGAGRVAGVSRPRRASGLLARLLGSLLRLFSRGAWSTQMSTWQTPWSSQNQQTRHQGIPVRSSAPDKQSQSF